MGALLLQGVHLLEQVIERQSLWFMLEFWISGRAIGKARPRFGKNGAVHTASAYGAWKNDAVVQLLRLNLPEAPRPARIECFFVNFASSDSDNLTGSVLDALVESGTLAGDSSSFVIESNGKFVKTRKKRGQDKPVGVLVRISSAQIEYVDLDLEALAA